MSDPGCTSADLERAAADLAADIAALERLAVDCLTQRSRLAAAANDRGAASILALGMHGYYTAVEAAIERIERLLAAPPPPGPSWHQELLWGATRAIGDVRPAILSAETAGNLDKLRGFRHFVRHAYAVELDPSELLRTAGHLEAVHTHLSTELERFVELLRRMSAQLSG